MSTPYGKAVAAIDGHPPIAAALQRAWAALDALEPVDVGHARSALVADLIDQLATGAATKALASLGADWAKPEAAAAEVDAKRAALGQAIDVLERQEQASVTAGTDTALEDLDRQLRDLLAAVPEDVATDQQVRVYDAIRQAQLRLLTGGNTSLDPGQRLLIADAGLVDQPEKVDPRIVAMLNGEPPDQIPDRSTGWWPTDDRAGHLAWLAHDCPAGPSVPTRAEMRACVDRVNRLLHEAQVNHQSIRNRYEPRTVRT